VTFREEGECRETVPAQATPAGNIVADGVTEEKAVVFLTEVKTKQTR
jgi:hypothetical protein